jgi:hypothetical protein
MSFEQIPGTSVSDRRDRSISAQQVAHGTASEQLHLRNYDSIEGYDLEIRLQREQQSAFERRVYLPPGAVRCLGEVVTPGNWQVTVSMDEKRQERAWCSLGPAVGQTAVLECGNGIIAVRERP